MFYEKGFLHFIHFHNMYIVCILHTFSNINGKYNIVFFLLTLKYTFILVITKNNL